LLGYDIGIAGGAMFIAKDVLSLTIVETEVILASLNFAAIPGAILARPVSDNLGRTKTLALASSLFLIGSIIMTIANGFWILLLGRTVLGLGVGTGLSIDPLYIAEIAPPAYRGTLVSWSEMSINIGILAGFVSAYAFSSYDPLVSWRYMFGLGGVFPIVMLILSTLYMPETPRYLNKVGQIEKAEIVLQRLCNDNATVTTILQDLKEDYNNRKDLNEVSFYNLIFQTKDVTIKYMLFTVIGAATAQQLSGVEAFMYYSPFLLQQVGFKRKSDILGLTAMMGLSKTITLLFAACLLDVKGAGRRRMLLWSYVGMAISLFMLAIGALTTTKGMVVVFIFSYVILFSVGAGPITWLFASEILPTTIRAKGMVLATCCNRLAGTIIGLTFLSASSASAGGALSVFAIFCSIFSIICWMYCPETQGKTLEEMYEIFFKMNSTDSRKVVLKSGGGGRIRYSLRKSRSKGVQGVDTRRMLDDVQKSETNLEMIDIDSIQVDIPEEK
jgi:sugar porter (SP) family MFS transporter